MNNEVRKLPKKTIIIIGVMIVIALVGFLFIKNLKEQKLMEILQIIGYKNIKDVTVINKLSVEDSETRYRSTVFKVMFYNQDSNQTCIGFIHKEKDNHYTKDIDCK
jgi:hypothetical protein